MRTGAIYDPNGYTFDPATGRHTGTQTDFTGTAYDYDALGRLWHVMVTALDGAAVADPPVTTYAYDAAGNKVGETLPNGAATIYGYDGLNRLTDLTTTAAGGATTLFAQHYELNADGRRGTSAEAQRQPDGTTVATDVAYAYDDLGRLTGEAATSTSTDRTYADAFAYDLAGNRVTKAHTGPAGGATGTTAYAYDGDDQMAAEGPDADADGTPDAGTAMAYAYDPNGSQVGRTDAAGLATTYGFDARNKLASVAAGGVTLATYAYDNAGNRVAEVAGGTTTLYLTDELNPTGYDQLVEERPAAGASPSRAYVLGDRVLGQAAGGAGAAGVTYLLADGHGSTQQLAGSAGAVAAAFRYDAFGGAVGFDPAAAGTPALFGGDALYDAASGLYVHGNGVRPRAGFRFVQRDAWGGNGNDPSTLHQYVYAEGNSVMFSDPSGYFADDDNLFDDVSPFELARDAVRSIDWSLSDLSLADQAFALADLHMLSFELQFRAVEQYAYRSLGTVGAASSFAFGMMDFLGDNVYVNPMQLALGWVGASACFTAGTQVVVGVNDDGSYATRDIEDVHVGDLVLARDQNDVDDDLDLRPVSQVFHRVSDHLRIVEIQDSSGNVEIIRTTDDHLFWVSNIGWVRAGDLRVEMNLLQPDGAEATVLTSLYEAHSMGVAVYNFEVKGDHTYFVEDGSGAETAVWVHNSCSEKLGRALSGANFKLMRAAGLAAHHLIPTGAAHIRQHVEKVFAAAGQVWNNNGVLNGVWLKNGAGEIHRQISGFVNHDRYVDTVWKRVGQLSSPDDIIKELGRISDELEKGTFKF